ncbi:MAG: histidine phosphatase family protein [Clostridia bacterium]|nr:histidine phosphatase family protein [Clostridia bacterium]
MRLTFIRHGHPNYQLDCLTELGHNQAEAVAARLEKDGIDKLFASSKGRAQETAAHIAEKLGLPFETLPFMAEIGWGNEDGTPSPFGGHPWYVAWDMAERGETLLSPDFAKEGAYAGNRVIRLAEEKNAAFDALLQELGYTREGEFYRVTKEPPYKNVAIVSHGGSSTAVIAHLLNWLLPHAYAMMEPHCTAITTLLLPDEVGKRFIPKIGLMNDARHIAGIEGSRNVISN